MDSHTLKTKGSWFISKSFLDEGFEKLSRGFTRDRFKNGQSVGQIVREPPDSKKLFFFQQCEPFFRFYVHSRKQAEIRRLSRCGILTFPYQPCGENYFLHSLVKLSPSTCLGTIYESPPRWQAGLFIAV